MTATILSAATNPEDNLRGHVDWLVDAIGECTALRLFVLSPNALQ